LGDAFDLIPQRSVVQHRQGKRGIGRKEFTGCREEKKDRKRKVLELLQGERERVGGGLAAPGGKGKGRTPQAGGGKKEGGES